MKSPIVFQPFDPFGEVRIYHHGILPHWRQTGCTYSVTFRLAGSLPQEVHLRLEEERFDWLRSRGIIGNYAGWKNLLSTLPEEQQSEYEREFGNRYNEQLDKGYGDCALRRPEVAKIVVEALKAFDEERVYTGNYVMMPNHVHVLLTPVAPDELEVLLQSIKG